MLGVRIWLAPTPTLPKRPLAAPGVPHPNTAPAHPDTLNAPAGGSGLSTVKGTAPSRPQLLRVGNGKRFDGVFAKHRGSLAGDVIDPRIRLVAVISQRPTAEIVVGQLGSI